MNLLLFRKNDRSVSPMRGKTRYGVNGYGAAASAAGHRASYFFFAQGESLWSRLSSAVSSLARAGSPRLAKHLDAQ